MAAKEVRFGEFYRPFSQGAGCCAAVNAKRHTLLHESGVPYLLPCTATEFQPMRWQACTVAMTTRLDSSDKAHPCFSLMSLKYNVTARRRRSFSAAISSSLLPLRSIADIPVGIIDVV
jgi:hypothetical protein